MKAFETNKLISKNIKEALSKIKVGKGIRKRKIYISKDKDLLCGVDFKIYKETICSLINSNKKERYKAILYMNYPSLKYSERAEEDEEYCKKKEKEKWERAEKQKRCLWCKVNFEKEGNKAPVLHHTNMNKMIKSMGKMKEIVTKEILEGRASIEYGFERLNEADISILGTYKLLIDCKLICNKCHRDYHNKKQIIYSINIL